MYGLSPRILSYSQKNVQLIPFHLCWRGETIGSAIIAVQNETTIRLQWFSIAIDYQGLGHGRKLYALIEAYIHHNLKAPKIHLSSVTAAVTFWTKMGYRSHGATINDIVPMIKVL
jgi:hypothetical protein